MCMSVWALLSRALMCLKALPHVFLLKELRKQEETGQLVQPVLFVLLVLVSVLLYFAVSLMDPGFILTDDTDLQVIHERNVCSCHYSYHYCLLRYWVRKLKTVTMLWQGRETDFSWYHLLWLLYNIAAVLCCSAGALLKAKVCININIVCVKCYQADSWFQNNEWLLHFNVAAGEGTAL